VLIEHCESRGELLEIALVSESFTMPDTKLSAWAKRHAVPIRVVSFVAGSIAVGYLWAVLFGGGIKGLQSVSQLDNSSTYPNANAAWIGAIALLSTSLLAAGKTVTNLRSPGRLLGRWLGAMVIAGAALFVVSRLFV
jgi:hypothetical protein